MDNNVINFKSRKEFDEDRVLKRLQNRINGVPEIENRLNELSYIERREYQERERKRKNYEIAAQYRKNNGNNTVK